MRSTRVHPGSSEIVLEVGQIVAGKYRLRKQIGEGAMGSVWAAVHEALDRHVAIKFLNPSQEDRGVASARFVREAKSAARVKHRFVVDVFDFGVTDEGEYFMVQELLDGEELAVAMQLGKPWSARAAVQLVMQVLSGLDAVHKAGLVHRDLKPENIFVVRDNDGSFPKLLDFGISKVAEPSAPARPSMPPPAPGAKRPRLKQLTKVGVTLGTPAYMSPEQLRGSRDLDARADLYSVGVLLYQWLTGHLPYAHDNLAELADQVASRSAPALSDMRPEMGKALSQVVARALEPLREKRYQSAQEMRDALSETLSAIPVSAKCATSCSNTRAAPAKTQVMIAPIASPLKEHLATLTRLAPRFVRNMPRAWVWAIASCFALLVLAFSLLRDARPGLANAEQSGGTILVIGASPEVSTREPAAPAVAAPMPAEAHEPEPEVPEVPAKRKKKPKRAKRPADVPPEWAIP